MISWPIPNLKPWDSRVEAFSLRRARWSTSVSATDHRSGSVPRVVQVDCKVIRACQVPQCSRRPVIFAALPQAEPLMVRTSDHPLTRDFCPLLVGCNLTHDTSQTIPSPMPVCMHFTVGKTFRGCMQACPQASAGMPQCSLSHQLSVLRQPARYARSRAL